MSEFTGSKFCSKCGKVTLHMLSGSGKKGSCEDCGAEWKQEVVNGMLRMSPELHEEIQNAALKDHNSLNGWILAACEQRLDRLAIEQERMEAAE